MATAVKGGFVELVPIRLDKTEGRSPPGLVASARNKLEFPFPSPVFYSPSKTPASRVESFISKATALYHSAGYEMVDLS